MSQEKKKLPDVLRETTNKRLRELDVESLMKKRKRLEREIESYHGLIKELEDEVQIIERIIDRTKNDPEYVSDVLKALLDGEHVILPVGDVDKDMENFHKVGKLPMFERIPCTVEGNVRVTFKGYKFNVVDKVIVGHAEDESGVFVEGGKPYDNMGALNFTHADWEKSILPTIDTSNAAPSEGFDLFDGQTPYTRIPYSVDAVVYRLIK